MAVETRWSRADEKTKRVAEIQLASQGRMGRATGVADTLCCLELDVARYQDRIARSAAHFLCRYPFSCRNHRPFCRIPGACGIVTAARVRLCAPGVYWHSDVCLKLRPPFLGRAARFIRAGSRVAGDHPDLRHALRASNASRRTIATAQTSRCTPRGRGRSNDLRASSRFQRLDGVLGRAWYHTRSRERCFFERAAKIAQRATCSGDDCCVANDFRRSTLALDRSRCRRKSIAVSLERGLDFLPALSRGDRLGAHLFASLLVVAANDRREAASNLTHHAAWRRRVRLGIWGGDIFAVVASWCMPGARRCLDDFPKRRRGRAGDPGRLVFLFPLML